MKTADDFCLPEKHPKLDRRIEQILKQMEERDLPADQVLRHMRTLTRLYEAKGAQ